MTCKQRVYTAMVRMLEEFEVFEDLRMTGSGNKHSSVTLLVHVEAKRLIPAGHHAGTPPDPASSILSQQPS
jgi:hypothetical protein